MPALNQGRLLFLILRKHMDLWCQILFSKKKFLGGHILGSNDVDF